ncbi:hypothetical protein [Streptomyces sp. NPDC051684]|uniref:hypothetical protein n=1 Tax=Streptomyces sp. NPDC051684 TaxID=3365670 RepID=UPI0037AE0CE8
MATSCDHAPDPWDRQPDESAEDFRRFRIFLGMGPARTLRDAAGELGLSYGRTRNLAASRQWTERVDAYDREAEQLWALGARHLQQRLATASMEGLLKVLATATAQVPAPDDAETLTPREAAALVVSAAKSARDWLPRPADVATSPASDSGARLADPELMSLFREILDALAPFPAAQEAVIRVLEISAVRA